MTEKLPVTLAVEAAIRRDPMPVEPLAVRITPVAALVNDASGEFIADALPLAALFHPICAVLPTAILGPAVLRRKTTLAESSVPVPNDAIPPPKKDAGAVPSPRTIAIPGR